MNKRIKKKHTKKALEEKVRELLQERRELVVKQMQFIDAAAQINSALNSVLIEVAKKYGEKVVEENEELGFRLEIPTPKTGQNFDVRTNKNEETGLLTIGVIKK